MSHEKSFTNKENKALLWNLMYECGVFKGIESKYLQNSMLLVQYFYLLLVVLKILYLCEPNAASNIVFISPPMGLSKSSEKSISSGCFFFNKSSNSFCFFSKLLLKC